MKLELELTKEQLEVIKQALETSTDFFSWDEAEEDEDSESIFFDFIEPTLIEVIKEINKLLSKT